MSQYPAAIRRTTDPKTGQRTVYRAVIKRRDIDEARYTRMLDDAWNTEQTPFSAEVDEAGDEGPKWFAVAVEVEVGAPIPGEDPPYWTGFAGTVRSCVEVVRRWPDGRRAHAYWDDEEGQGKQAVNRLLTSVCCSPDALSPDDFIAPEEELAEAARRFGGTPVPVRVVLTSDTPNVTVPRNREREP